MFVASALAVILTAGHLTGARAGQVTRSEYDVKAAFVYNFIKFVTWPSGEESSRETVQLCILGSLPDTAAFDDLDDKAILGKKLRIVYLKDMQEARNCSVLFLSSKLSPRLPEVLEIIRGRPVLTIGDTEGYGRRGVMINMFLENKRIRFEINEEQARTAGLRISVKLLKLAGKVYMPDVRDGQ